MADGARQVVTGAKGFYDTKVAPAVERSGAKDFFNDRVAPAAQNAARSARTAYNNQRRNPRSGLQRWSSRAPFILPVAAFLAIISLFLPIASMLDISVNFFSDELDESDGGLILFLMIVVIAASVVFFILKVKWARIVAGVAGVVAGLAGMIDGFGNMISISGHTGASVGAGLVFLALLSVVVTAAGVLVLIPSPRTPRSEQPQARP
jgi:hypothetical protein